MKKTLIFTKSKARLKLLRSDNRKPYHWLFLPGGPGLGSESLHELNEILDLPGSMWHVDLPGDGANTSENDRKNFSDWNKALIEACAELNNVILVAHSTGGMFALATPELENNLIGLVLMDSAPNAGWQQGFMQYVKSHPLPAVEKLQKLYEEKPSNDLLKRLTIASAPYISTQENLSKIIVMLDSLPFNCESHLWAETNFDQTYQAKWIPQKIPTLIFAGDKDHITPLKLFSELKEFQRKNIVMQEIKNAAHFPWIDNPEQVKKVFAEYCHWLDVIPFQSV